MKSLVECIIESSEGFRWDNDFLYRNHASKQKDLDKMSNPQWKRFAKDVATEEELDLDFVLLALKALAGNHVWASTTDFQKYDLDGEQTLVGHWSGKNHVYDVDAKEWTELKD